MWTVTALLSSLLSLCEFFFLSSSAHFFPLKDETEQRPVASCCHQVSVSQVGRTQLSYLNTQTTFHLLMWEKGTEFWTNTAAEEAFCYSGQVHFFYLWCIPGDETFIIAAVLARPGWAAAAGWSQAHQQFPFFLQEARKPKTRLLPWGNIGIFNNMLWKNQFLHPSFGRAPTLSKILHSTPNPRRAEPPHSLEPPSSYELHYSDPGLPFMSLRMFM